MQLLIGQILPYITVILFTLGVMYRLGRWVGARIVHNITLSPWLNNNTEVAIRIGSEAFLFRNLFRFDKALWAGAILMHIALLSIIVGHVVGFSLLGQQFALIPGLGITPELSKAMSNILGTVFGILLFVALLYLLYRRVSIRPVRETTRLSDNLWLVYLIALVGVGNIMRLFPAVNVGYVPVRDYMLALATFQPVMGMSLLDNGFFLVHYLLVQVMLIILPFSKLMHLFGMFAERWIVNRVYKDPAPGIPDVDVAAARKAGIGVPSGDTAGEGV